jgi:hypothetical protein
VFSFFGRKKSGEEDEMRQSHVGETDGRARSFDLVSRY